MFAKIDGSFLPLCVLSHLACRHKEARAEVEKGLELLSEYRRLPAIKWPGTNDLITECLPQNIEVNSAVPTFLCPYLNILKKSSFFFK